MSNEGGYKRVPNSEEDSDNLLAEFGDEENQCMRPGHEHGQPDIEVCTCSAQQLQFEQKQIKKMELFIVGMILALVAFWASTHGLPRLNNNTHEVIQSTLAPHSSSSSDAFHPSTNANELIESTLSPHASSESMLREKEYKDTNRTTEYKTESTVAPSFKDYLAKQKFPLPGSAADRAEDERDVELYFSWLTKRQSPEDCETVETENFWHPNGIGSILQTWKNTFIRSIARGKVLTSGFRNTYSNPNVCPSRQFEQCVLQPISTCKNKNPNSYKMSFSPCQTEFPQEKISNEAKMSQVRSIGWFHAQSMRYLLRPRPSLTKLIEQVKNTLGLTDMRRVLSVHIRHGDLGAPMAGDKRTPINTNFYALMASVMAFWDKFDVVLVGSDDAEAFQIVHDHVTSKAAKKIRVIEFPTDIFEMLPKSRGEMAHQLKVLHQVKPQDKDVPVKAEDDENVPVKAEDDENVSVKLGDENVQEKSEDAALLAEMFVMAQSGGFLGSLNSNFGRTVYELAGGEESGRLLMDIEGRPYFGCQWNKEMPTGGGSRMYPFSRWASP